MPFEGLQLAFGRYHLIRLLGSGGMGEVYLAEDTRIARQVAIKIVRTELTPYPNASTIQHARQLFEREMKAISMLDHPHILPLYDYGEEEFQGTPLIYMVMPYRPEGSLAGWLRQHEEEGLLAPPDVAALISQAADALQHAHDHQLIHQDVKPSNFLIRLRPDQPQRPDLFLTDFGIARFTGSTSNTSQTIRGTPTYMAPEQWEGHPTYATDQYALAIMAYELLVGHPPFQGGPGPMMYQHLQKVPAAPSSQNPALTPAIDVVLLRALAKRPEDRFPSVSSFARALEQAILSEEATISSTRLGTGAGPTGGLGPIEAPLAISSSEAFNGARRTLNVAGEELEVTIPPGVVDGQVIYVEGWRRGRPHEGPVSLLLRLDVVPDELLARRAGSSADLYPTMLNNTQVPPGLARPTRPIGPAEADQRIVLAARGDLQTLPAQNITTASPWTPAPPGSGTWQQLGEPPGRQQSGASGLKVIFFVLLALLIMSSAGLLYYFLVASGPSSNNNNTNTNLSASLTATAAANNATAQAQANNNATATAQTQASATAQAQAQATATAQTQAQAQATATAQAQATATAQAQQTATAQATPPQLSVDKTSLQAHAGSSTDDCSYTTVSVKNISAPAWSCALTLSNQGFQNLNWASSVSATATQGHTFLADAAGLLTPLQPKKPQVTGVYVSPASGSIAAQGTQQVTLIILDTSHGTSCPLTGYSVTFTGPANTVIVHWSCG